MAQQVLTIFEPQQLRNSFRTSSSQEDDETLCKNSANQYSQKSLLTQALRATSQQSNIDTFEQQYISHVLLKPRFQDYSLTEQANGEDELQKFSLRSVRCDGKSKEKILTSFVQETQGKDKENNKRKTKKEIRLKTKDSQCSKCEIF